MIRKYAEIFCWKNVSSIFSAKNIRISCIESAKTVNEMTLNKLIKLTTFWTTGPRMHVTVLTLCMLGNITCFFVICGFFFLKLTFSKKKKKKKKIFQENHQCQTGLIQIRPNVLSGLIWVQTVCKGYQQMTNVATSGERGNEDWYTSKGGTLSKLLFASFLKRIRSLWFLFAENGLLQKGSVCSLVGNFKREQILSCKSSPLSRMEYAR